MKHPFSRMAVSLLLCIPLYNSVAEETTAAAVAAPTQAQMEAMQQQMQAMQSQITKMMAAKTPQERSAAMQAHMTTMQEHMKTMDQMGCCGHNGMMGEHMQGGSMMMGDCMHQNTTK